MYSVAMSTTLGRICGPSFRESQPVQLESFFIGPRRSSRVSKENEKARFGFVPQMGGGNAICTSSGMNEP